MKKKLVIVTTHFGTNFSGGSTATCEIFQPLESEFEEIHVVGTQLGVHNFKSINFIKYRSWFQLRGILKKFDAKSTIFYGDFFNSFILATLKKPFFFTYHDNWPELAKFGLKNRILSIFYTTAYLLIFRNATKVFTVSKFKLDFVKKHTNQHSLIRNGFRDHIDKTPTQNDIKKVLMIGNIDDRKYRLALPLLKELSIHSGFEVDVFGNVMDRNIMNKLQSYPFVKIKGYHSKIPFKNYKLLLHTSAMENLPMVHCEAIANNIPVIAFDVGGTREIITEKNGVLIKPYDTNSMAKKILEVLNNEIHFECNHESILKEYTWSKASKKYKKEILGEVVNYD